MKSILSFRGLAAVVSLCSLAPVAALAEPPSASTTVGPITIPMELVTADGEATPIGTITVRDIGYGLLIEPALSGLPPGLHGFHVHENPSCEAAEKDGAMTAGLAAGGHYDPAGTRRHDGPYGNGHLGDLPALYVGPDGKAGYPLLAPRLKVVDLQGRALMIHAGGDNHADHPSPLGGGGARIACGVTPRQPKR